jgi:hypothetical protein
MADLPVWAAKCRLWRSEFEACLEPHYRDKISKLAVVHTFKTDLGGIAGQYSRNGLHSFHEIKMSVYLTENEARDTYGHEFAHLIVFHFYGSEGHGFIWKSFMSLFGLAALEFHDYPLDARCVIEEVNSKLKGIPDARRDRMGDQGEGR